MKEGRLFEKFDLKTWSLLFFCVSFFGWVFETVVCYVQSGHITDRGFLSLPFCPIYGFPVCVIYFLLGTPTNGLFFRLIAEKNKARKIYFQKALAVLFYFLTAALFATAVEFIVGVSFNRIGLSLWSYGDTPLTFMTVISLPVSLVWGGLITIFAQFCIRPLMRSISKIPERKRQFLACLFWTAILADFLANGVYFLLSGKHFII